MFYKPPYVNALVRPTNDMAEAELAYQFREIETLNSILGGSLEQRTYDAYKEDIAKESI